MTRWRMFVMRIFVKGYLRLHEYDCEGHIVLQIHNLFLHQTLRLYNTVELDGVVEGVMMIKNTIIQTLPHSLKI
jgi:hypothetical protein